METFRGVAAKIGNEAIGLISKDRAKTHGHALTQHQVLADLWTAYLRGRGKLEHDVKLTGHEAAMLLLLLKCSRDAVGAHNRDNFVDAVGYSCIAGAIREFEEKDNAGVQEGWKDRPEKAAPDRGEAVAPAWGGRDGQSATALGGERRAKFGQ